MGTPFDWPAFLAAHGIEYVTSGPNISKGNVGVACPFCTFGGDPDPSQHMSISLDGKGWFCRRNRQHSGKSPTKLVQALIGCSYVAALAITGTEVSFIPDDFMAELRGVLNPLPDHQVFHHLALPPEFNTFSISRWSAKPFVSYLTARGFDDATISKLTKNYGVYYATRGPWKGRIVFAVYFQKQLVSWTGRTIYNVPGVVRYLTLTTDPERAAKLGLPPAAGPVTNYLLWYDQLMRNDADTIYICEGPFDALKVSVLGAPHGICATCLFTSAYTEGQRACLHDLLPRFKRRYILLDREQRTLPISMRMETDLVALKVHAKILPDSVNDPAELSECQLLKMI